MVGIGIFLWYSINNIAYIYMPIYIGNNLEDRLEALEMEKTSSKKCDLEDRLKALKKTQ